MSFIETYFRYNQIPMLKIIKNKTTLMMEHTNYRYNVMPFGLKNTCALYQTMTYMIFEEEIGEMIEAYMTI